MRSGLSAGGCVCQTVVPSADPPSRTSMARPLRPAVMRAHPQGAEAALIGEVVADPHAFVQMETSFGGRRVVDWLTGEQLPRIC